MPTFQYVPPTHAVAYGALAGLSVLALIGHPVMTLAGLAIGAGLYFFTNLFR